MIKKLFQPTDMTIGTPWKSILLFSIPMILGNIAQQLYSTVDSIIVGHYEGDNALAAVGSTLPILNMLLVLFMGISAGVSIMVAQYLGARSREDLSKTVGTGITITGLVSLVLMVVSPFFVNPILVGLNTPPEIIEQCASYLTISMIGVAGMAYYNILSGILRGLGDSFSALIYLVVATIVNIVLDIVFVAVFRMGVSGVALATIIAQLTSSALCLIKLTRMKDMFDLTAKSLKISKKHLNRIVKLGLPSGATQAIISSAMIIVQSLTNSFGAMFIAANTIVMRVDGFAMMPNFSFGMAMTTYAGQNVGACKFDRVTKGAKQGTLIAVICSTIITGIILLFGKNLMGIFTETTELVDYSAKLMRILAVGYIAMAITQSLSGIMRGAGDTVTPMWITLITSVFMRVPLAYGLVAIFHRPECMQVSLLTTWLIAALINFICYRVGKWKKKAKVM